VFNQPAVLSGGTLRSGMLMLPTPLSAGESHEFWVRSHNPARPRQFLYFPRRRCDHLELRVHFGCNHLPHEVSRLQGRPPRDLGRITLSQAGEVRIVFRDAIRGSAYGARWQ
jgi:hypothetical protein